MRPEDDKARQRHVGERDLGDGEGLSPTVSRMTSRGTKYWSSGAIPLIAPEILGDIISAVADLSIVISEDGVILSVLANPAQSRFQKLDQWEGRNIRSTMTVESVPKFDSRLAQFLQHDSAVRPLEINHADDVGNWEFPVRYSFHTVGPDGAILLLGRDLRPVAEMQQQLVKAQLALERDYEVQREYDTRFRVVMEHIAEPVVFVSVRTSKITEANPAAAAVLGVSRDALVGSALSEFFEQRKRGDLVDVLATHVVTEPSKAITAKRRGAGTVLTIAPTLFRSAGERVLMCRLLASDQDVAADDLTRNLRDLYFGTPEAIVFASDTGEVLSANDAFLELIGMAHDIDLRGRGLADFLQRGSVDFKVMTENAARAGRMRMYATKVLGDYGVPRAVEVSVTRLHAGTNTVFAFVMREAGQGDMPRSGVIPMPDDDMQSVAELVGSASLKDIVAETTDVVEKMCIETAVKLTMNNRVAAAEMLGLSRQSLYVKLRKFNLLSRDADDLS